MEYSGTPLFRTPWDQFSGPLYSGHLGTSTVGPLYSGHLGTSTADLSIPDTLGPERTVLIIEVSSFQGLRMYYGKAFWIIWFQRCLSTYKGCLQFRGWIRGFHCSNKAFLCSIRLNCDKLYFLGNTYVCERIRNGKLAIRPSLGCHFMMEV